MVWEDSHPQDLKGASPSRTSAPTRGLIGVIHRANQHMETARASPQVLTAGLTSDPELDSPLPKKGH